MNDDRSILHQFGAKRVTLKGTQRDDNATERYDLVGELARGGVGIVHRGRDNDIGRDVALKVLLDGHLDNPELVQRFVEEAQIGGQLQHPGIVPVYELGLRGDKRPYFAMKLVKGETLAARLAKGTEARRALLAVFREVCRTVAYAHARGVIHRDLKPSNVMIGNFGEVQVVDWGFAKVLRKGGVADERLAKKAERDITMISTVRSDEGSAPSVAGSVMGTPAYMPPEQALGRVEDLDEKSDLFSLGAILAEILTGQPPYSGADRMHDAAQALLEPVYRRLDECDADSKLVKLCKRCLQPLPKNRPASAELLADEVAAYLTSADKRSHRARLRALRAEERAAAQRRARRLTTMTGASVAAALLIAFAAYFWIDAGRRDRARERQAKIEAALQDAAQYQAAKQWPEALAAAERAAALGDDGKLAREILTQSDAAAELQTRLDDDRALLAELEEARSMGTDHYSKETIDATYLAAVKKRWPTLEIDTQRLKESEHREAFAAAFDAWASFRRLKGMDWKDMDAWARGIDSGANELRDAISDEDGAALEELLAESDVAAMPVARIADAGYALLRAGRDDAALEFLRRAHRAHPDDFWINMRLGWAAAEKDPNLHLRHRIAALAARPDSLEARHWLGIALENKGDFDGALDVWRDALKRKPDWAHGLRHVADALAAQGKLDEALATYEAAIQRDPSDYDIHIRMGQFLRDKLNRRDEALALFYKAGEIDPDLAVAHNRVGIALSESGDYAGAAAAFRKAIECRPEDDSNWTSLGNVLLRLGKVDEAIRACNKALELAPDSGGAHNNLGLALQAKRDLDGAVRSLERAGELAGPRKLADVLSNLGTAYLDRANRKRPPDRTDVEKAIAAYEQALEGRPSDPAVTWGNLGNALTYAERFDDAVKALRKSVSHNPRNHITLFLLGNALIWKKEYNAAVEELEKALALRPSYLKARDTLATALEAQGDIDGAAAVLGEDARLALNLGWLFDRHGRFDEAVVAFEQAAKLAPEDPVPHYNLGTMLRRIGKLEEAVAPLEEAVRLYPKYPEAWCNLGLCLRDLGRWSEAAAALRKGHRFGTARGNWTHRSDLWLARTERMAKLEPALERVLAGEPVKLTPEERALMAEMLKVKRRFDLSIQSYREAFRADPQLAKLGTRYLYLAIRAAIDGGNRAQALAWCRDYLDGLRKADAARAVNEMNELLHQPELAPIRDADDLPDEWKKFWAEVKALRDKLAK